jgi:hypothetical protein
MYARPSDVRQLYCLLISCASCLEQGENSFDVTVFIELNYYVEGSEVR